jgi:hypothetical protein
MDWGNLRRGLLECDFQFDAGVVYAWGDLAAWALLEVDQAVALHGFEGSGEVRLGAPGGLGEF